MKLKTATPYIASFVILRRGNKIAFVLRQNTVWMNGYYGLPAGKVEQNESFSQAAIREAKEEVGITIKPQHLHHILTGHRNEPNSTNANFWVDVFFEVSQWSGEPYNAEPHMHGEFVWLDPNNLPKNVVSSVRFYIEQIQAGKTYAEYGWQE